MKNKENQFNTQLFELNKRLGVVIALFLKMASKTTNGFSLKEQVEILADIGVRPKDIAGILGRTPTHITKELAGIRKKFDKKR